jgi:hypothetical protein
MWWGKLVLSSSRAAELSLAFTRHSKDSTVDDLACGICRSEPCLRTEDLDDYRLVTHYESPATARIVPSTMTIKVLDPARGDKIRSRAT